MSELNTTGMGMKLNMEFELVYKDKDGNVIGTTQAKGSFPLSEEQQITIQGVEQWHSRLAD